MTGNYGMVKRGQLVCVFLAVFIIAGPAAVPTVSHPIEVSHPSSHEGQPFAVSLTQVKSGKGETEEFFMDVDSVICADEKCEIIPVRIHWDLIGRFTRYELPAGGELTRKGHEAFTKADHKLLHRILSDAQSPLRWVSSDEIVPPEKAMEEEDVDGFSGATVLSEKGTVVEGAAYTCHTLWHWANGEACDEIRRITGQEADAGDLLGFLESGDYELVVFALEKLMERQVNEAAILAAVTGIVEREDQSLAQLALQCIERVSATSEDDHYFGTLERLFARSNRQKRVLFLRSLSATRLKAPAGYYDRVSRWLGILESYYEIHLLLNLMESRNPASAEVVKQVIPVLDNTNFLIARRAYYFLKGGTLDESQQKRVEAFRTGHEERL